MERPKNIYNLLVLNSENAKCEKDFFWGVGGGVAYMCIYVYVYICTYVCINVYVFMYMFLSYV